MSVSDELELDDDDGDVVNVCHCFRDNATVRSLLQPALPTVLAERLSQLLSALVIILDVE